MQCWELIDQQPLLMNHPQDSWAGAMVPGAGAVASGAAAEISRAAAEISGAGQVMSRLSSRQNGRICAYKYLARSMERPAGGRTGGRESLDNCDSEVDRTLKDWSE